MRKFTFILSLLVAFVTTTMAQNVVYQRNATTYSAVQLNELTEATMIAVKNLSGTNGRYLAANENVAEFGYEAVLVWEPAVENTAGTYHIRRLSAGENGYIQAAASGKVTLGAKATAQVFVAVIPNEPTNETLNSDNNGILVRFKQNDADTWLNCQHESNTPVLGNTGQGGWTMHNVYGVDALSTVPVTYRYILDGVEKKSTTIEQAIGAEINAPAVPYVTLEYPEGNVTAETTTVDVTCTQNLPFTVSESYADATWYYMTIRSDNQKYVSRSESAPYTNSTSIPDDANGRWAFMGNVFDGITILNNGAGEGYTLGYDTTETGSNIYMKEGNTTWIIEEGVGGFLLRQSGDYEYAHDYSSCLQFWNSSSASTDPGSAFITYDVETIEATLIADFKAHATSGLGYVGGYTVDKADAINAIKTYAEVEAFKAANTPIAFDESKYYRIQNVYRTTFISVANGERVLEEKDNSDANQLWMIKNGSTNGAYLIKSPNAGYMQAVGKNTLSESSTELAITSFGEGYGQYAIKSGNDMLAGINNTTLGTWWNGTIDSDMSYRFIETTDIEISVSEFASLYLPFAVEVEGATAYAIEETNSTHAILAEKADIPANQGAILAGNGTAKLNIINDATSDWTKNMLKGSTIDTYVAGPAYILSKSKGGLYKAALNKDADGNVGETHFKNNANKAYLVVEGASESASYGLRLPGTTGIENVTVENGVKAIFDLTGRRVESVTAPGIYIVNGKKVLVK